MFCHKCGKEIDDDAVVCIHCGASTKNLKNNDTAPINIVNQSSSSSSAEVKVKVKRHSGLLDFIMICCTGGLWIIWMLIRD